MLISFSGAQSTGKSTLLQIWQESVPEWHFIPEITRLVQRDFNLPINEKGDDLTQTLILGEHLRNAFQKRDQHTILDRCSLDGMVYTRWLHDKGKVSDRTLENANYIFSKTIAKYDCILYTSPEDVPIVDDGVRSINKQFREEIIKLFNVYNNYVSNKVLYKISGTVAERVNQINSIFKRLGIL